MIECWKLCLKDNGKYEQELHRRIDFGNIDSVTKQLPKGGYTTFRTYKLEKALRFDDHIQRLLKTAELSNVDVNIDQRTIRETIRSVIGENKNRNLDSRIRIIVDFEKEIGDVYIIVDKLKVLADTHYEVGVQVVTNDNITRMNPKAKLTSFIEETKMVRDNLPETINEILLIDHMGYVTEGMTSNFFAIMDAKIYTSNRSILNGITRDIVLSVIKNKRIPMSFQPLYEKELNNIQEAFLTSSSRGVLPIRNINDVQIGEGGLGKITEVIRKETSTKILNEIERI